jgi:hypothetical protein
MDLINDKIFVLGYQGVRTELNICNLICHALEECPCVRCVREANMVRHEVSIYVMLDVLRKLDGQDPSRLAHHNSTLPRSSQLLGEMVHELLWNTKTSEG